MFGQLIATAGFILFTLVISWVFGREFADGTVKDLLAVPVARSTILLAKFIVAAVWSLGLALILLAVGLILGALFGLPGGANRVLVQGSAAIMITACLVIMVVLPFAFFASVGRGYLLPIGAAVVALMAANLAAVVGRGEVFPWSIPAVYAMGSPLTLPGLGMVLLLALAGVAVTQLWWQRADQNR
jgi:ABC-2 type transport system permease protein